ncbi:glycoside hydrolase family 2 TIM barrel-domain containing protein [Chitinophaga sp. Cy-1792]|uniref:glycoside hydrolase family 2 TIM barrel-domain containing protein n=1 Tax=Chitinophaga sp. Cy-1792 TaxID=2608339 RepID=UPI0014227599|nr:glycoside hydrolase family 2 TIM barrel-domain containing protein [Chitinophaga sp. Cy-1792]NIG55332.1 glycoside hydrolase family 2 protein [Chitinophaga sp. Cy-1792]
MKIISLKYLLLLICLLQLQSIQAQQDFNSGWKFLLGDDSLAIGPQYNDASWRVLNLPHDWSIEGNFAASHPATTQGGALPTGICWYRKTFALPAAEADKAVSIEFDGVYRDSEVWINGHYLGKRPNGYISFDYELTPYLKYGAPNVIAVKVDNSGQPNSRWYTGSGIYRNVRLVVKGKAGYRRNGIVVDARYVLDSLSHTDLGFIRVQSSIYNHTGKKIKYTTAVKISDPAGKIVDSVISPENYLVDKEEIIRTTDFAGAVLKPWSPDAPNYYKVLTIFSQDQMQPDTVVTITGIRSFRFDPQHGFFLNSKPLKIKGVCLHHDLGALGAAVNVRAMERQLEILKAMGCNAIRTAHNPPAPEFLDLCDKMGFLVMEEAFDMWEKKKNKYDYHKDFAAWHKRDVEAMVLRDRNHPSVFMWSIGNEIREQFDSSGIALGKELVDIIKAIDTTRPVTGALSEWNPLKNFIYQSHALDVVGLNYHQEVYEDFHKYYPGEIFLGTENMSAFATRGYYDQRSDSTYFWPAKSPQKIVEKGNPDYTVSAYDQVSAYWGSTHEATWKIIRKHDYLSGLFVWSGFDFLGEPIPYPWPARSSYYGIIDLAGFPKDVYYMYQSEWTTKPVLHVFPHWNWQPGQVVDVWVYYNNADEVELFLNGKSLGIQSKGPEDLHLVWKVPFVAGTLKAVSRKNGKQVLVQEIKTAGAPAAIALQADRPVIEADGKDLSYVTLQITDAKGNPVPYADNQVHFTIEGPGIIAGTDNGYQADTISLKSPSRQCWKGMALAIVQSDGKKGTIRLRATGAGLKPAVITIRPE